MTVRTIYLLPKKNRLAHVYTKYILPAAGLGIQYFSLCNLLRIRPRAVFILHFPPRPHY